MNGRDRQQLQMPGREQDRHRIVVTGIAVDQNLRFFCHRICICARADAGGPLYSAAARPGVAKDCDLRLGKTSLANSLKPRSATS